MSRKVDDRHPIVVGVGQVTRRDQDWPAIDGPLELMLEATARAEADAGGNLLHHVDQLTVVNVISWDYGDAPALLADRLGLDSRVQRRYLAPGGNTPQRAVNDLARRLAAGEIEVALVSGAEAMAGKRAARRSGHLVDWGRAADPLRRVDERAACDPTEAAQGLERPIITYPLWEPAIRVAAGRTPDEHRDVIGRLMSDATAVAAENPHAWFRERRTPDELMTVGDGNRMISTPYPKLVNAIMRVDQGAALLLTTTGKARALGIPDDRFVYILGGGDCNDIWHLTERTTYTRSPGMERLARQTRESSGIGSDEIAHLDLYSCFPSAVQLAMGALGIPVGDPRPVTVTGGLAYAGGPGNNYVTHAIATMVDTLRADPGEVGLCTGLGWHVTKHSAGLYSAAPPTRPYTPVDPGPDQTAIDAEPHPVIEARPSGTATIEGYSVAYHRDGQPATARCLARLDRDRRSVVSSSDPSTCAALVHGEWHGREIEVTPDNEFRV